MSVGTAPLALPDAAATVTLTPVRVRKAATVIQEPAVSNGYAAIIELDDVGISGADTYVVDVEVVPR